MSKHPEFTTTATMLISRDLAGSRTNDVHVHMHSEFIVIGTPLLYFEINFTEYFSNDSAGEKMGSVSICSVLTEESALVKELKLSLWSH